MFFHFWFPTIYNFLFLICLQLFQVHFVHYHEHDVLFSIKLLLPIEKKMKANYPIESYQNIPINFFSHTLRMLKVHLEIIMRFYFLWKPDWLRKSQGSHSSSFSFCSLVICFFELQMFPVYSLILICSNMCRYWMMMGLLHQGKLLAHKISI